MADHHELIVIVDFGSQYTQLIARRVREAKVYCEMVPCTDDMTAFAERNVKGYILSGGPASLSDPLAPRTDPRLFTQGKPILGLCYGMQLMADQLGGELVPSTNREYGRARLTVRKSDGLFAGLGQNSQVWMSHGDSISRMPPGFELIGSTESLQVAAIADEKHRLYGLQFHPEVHHTEHGRDILHNFLFDVCGAAGDWSPEAFLDLAVDKVREQVQDGEVVLGISGGVDSTVAAMVLKEAIGERLHAVFVNNGLLRKNEFEDVTAMLRSLQLNLYPVDASDTFLARLAGVIDPEKKRKIIGNTFIDVFEGEAERLGRIDFLAQGTLYPDVIESVSFKGPSVTIKSHHNVGGLKERMRLKLVEPLRELFKDEVRQLGRVLGLPESFINRHPFPGPGLAVRILGEVTHERCNVLREVDAIFIEALYRHGIYNDIWQAFAVLLPVKAVGVMGDERTYENVVALRAVTSTDAMTADWARIDPDILGEVSNQIIRNVPGVNRVTYDISSKPPATIEWE
jgi:GMP synthase (glutamine-hydrolysing)